MILDEKLILSNNVQIPKLGLGTWMIGDSDVVQVVKDAIKVGYKHIDTAEAYDNEAGVGKGVKESGIKREDIFITSKLDASIKSYNEAVKAIDESIEKIGLDYIDLMIIHCPQPWSRYRQDERSYDEGNREAWKALEEAYKSGKLKSIGLSNFLEEDIKNIHKDCTVKPMINQILVHISNTPFELIKFSEDNGMLVEAYSPIAHGELLKNEDVKRIADKYNVSIPQLSIRYTLQLGLISLPKASTFEHIKSNADLDFEISSEDMVYLKNLKQIENYGKLHMFPNFRI